MTPALPGGFGRIERMVVVSAVGFVLVLCAVAVMAGGRGVLAALAAVPGWIFVAMLGLSAFNYLCRGLRWLLFSRAMGIAVPVASNALYYLAGFAMTTTPGKVGEALRLWFLRRGHGCRYADTVGLLIADRLWDAVAMSVVLCASVAWLASYLWVSLAAAAIVAGVTLLCLRPSVLRNTVGFAAGVLPRRRRMFATWRRSLRTLERLARPDIFGLGLALGCAGWAAEAVSLYVLVQALGVPIAPMACVFIFAFAMMVGAISVLPGGLGSTEATLAGLLVLQGMRLQDAIVATAVVRVTTLWFAVALGMLSLPVAFHRADRSARVAA